MTAEATNTDERAALDALKARLRTKDGVLVARYQYRFYETVGAETCVRDGENVMHASLGLAAAVAVLPLAGPRLSEDEFTAQAREIYRATHAFRVLAPSDREEPGG